MKWLNMNETETKLENEKLALSYHIYISLALSYHSYGSLALRCHGYSNLVTVGFMRGK